MPPDTRQVQAITWKYLHLIHFSLLKFRVPLQIRFVEIHRAVIMRHHYIFTLPCHPGPGAARVYVFAVPGRNEGEILVAFIDAHKVLVAVCVGQGDSSYAVPISSDGWI